MAYPNAIGIQVSSKSHDVITPAKLCRISASDQQYTCKLPAKFSPSMVKFSSENHQDCLALISAGLITQSLLSGDQCLVSSKTPIFRGLADSLCRLRLLSTRKTPELQSFLSRSQQQVKPVVRSRQTQIERVYWGPVQGSPHLLEPDHGGTTLVLTPILACPPVLVSAHSLSCTPMARSHCLLVHTLLLDLGTYPYTRKPVDPYSSTDSYPTTMGPVWLLHGYGCRYAMEHPSVTRAIAQV